MTSSAIAHRTYSTLLLPVGVILLSPVAKSNDLHLWTNECKVGLSVIPNNGWMAFKDCTRKLALYLLSFAFGRFGTFFHSVLYL